MKISERVRIMMERANRHGLSVADQPSGEGYTKYKFRTIEEHDLPYYATNGIYIALGIKEAEAWLDGWVQCWYNKGYAEIALNQMKERLET